MLPRIALTRSTHAQLSLLVRFLHGQADEEVLEFLEQELARADLVGDDELGRTVAAIGSRVLYRDDVAGVEKVGTLVLPGDEHRVHGGLSVLEPEGACLLGLSEGQSMTFWRASKAVCDVTLESILDPAG